MLIDQLEKFRRNPALVLIALAGGLLLGVLTGAVVDPRGRGFIRAADSAAGTAVAAGSTRDRGVRRPTTGPATQRPATARSNSASGARVQGREVLQAALNRGVEAAGKLRGEAAAAVWVNGDSRPILSGPTRVPHRLWSMSKAVVSVAALRATHDQPDSVLRSAMTDAIRRSDNCAIRRVIVGLQDRLREGISGTVAAFERVLATARARIEHTPQSGSAEPACVRYLDGHQGGLSGSDPGVAPEFGTAEWTEYDAISFAHALSEQAYGASGAYLLRLMALPKEPPLERPPPPSAPELDWGAGAAFPADWHPAWKAGWGGSQDDPAHFLAGQIVVLHIAGVPVAVTAIFAPKTQPATDNPGITRAPQALELIFSAARAGLEDEHVGTFG